MLAIFKREFKSYFSTPIGYIFLAAFFYFSGDIFHDVYSYGLPRVELVISSLLQISILALPLLTMRLMSEDRRQKVDQALFTAPVKLTSVVLGKFLAAFAVYCIAFIPTIFFEIIVMNYVVVNVFTYLYALLGILLLGSALIAIGMFISCLTESSVISAILTLVINLLTMNLPMLAQSVGVEWIANVLEKLAFINMFVNFGNEYFSLPDVLYFLSITAAFLFLCVRVLEKRRWA